MPLTVIGSWQLRVGSRTSDSFSFSDFTGAGVKVAVVDSGINACHSHVMRVEGGVRIALNARGHVVFEDDCRDFIGHGTAVAGIIRRKAPDVELYCVKVFDRILSTRPVILAEAIRWAADHEMNVVNLSLGTTKKHHAPILREACDYAQTKGVITVAARDWQDRETYPADFPNVLSVAADERCGEDSYFCEEDEIVRFRASPYPRELPGFPQSYNLKGNSFAAAHLSGLVALILQSHPFADVTEVREMLVRHSRGR